MIKIKTLLILVIVMCFLTSCMSGGERTAMRGSKDEKDINAKFEVIANAINERDKDIIESLFSKNALDEADDFDENVKKLFAFVQGDIESWVKRTGSSTFGSIDHGQRKREFSAYYDVYTAEQQYFFLLRNCSIDTAQPDNVGLYLILVVKAEEEEKIWDGENKILFEGEVKIPRLGVYLPTE